MAWEAVLGAGALGALLGNVAGGNLLKNAALLGAGAVALNFIKNGLQASSRTMLHSRQIIRLRFPIKIRLLHRHPRCRALTSPLWN